MLKSYALYTSEIDDLDCAVDQIKTQAAALPLLSDTVGIVLCHHDYVSGGIVQALAQQLSFPLIGINTFYQVSTHAVGLFELTITVLTSDDVRFAMAAGGEAALGRPSDGVIADTYQRAFDRYGETPSLILSFLSSNRPVTGDEYLRALDECSGGVPSFGSVTTGDDDSGTNNFIICADTVSAHGFAILLMIGKLNASCTYGSFKEEKLLSLAAIVTQAHGETVSALNDQPALSFLRKNGLALEDGDHDKVSNVPFLYKLPNEGRYTARTLGGFDPDGSLRFLGEIPVGALLRISTISIEDLLDISRATIEQAVRENPDAKAFFVFSCLGRYITLGLDNTTELQHVAGVVPEGAPYIACYVGGEICPVQDEQGSKNRYHNSSIIVCALS